MHRSSTQRIADSSFETRANTSRRMCVTTPSTLGPSSLSTSPALKRTGTPWHISLNPLTALCKIAISTRIRIDSLLLYCARATGAPKTHTHTHTHTHAHAHAHAHARTKNPNIPAVLLTLAVLLANSLAFPMDFHSQATRLDDDVRPCPRLYRAPRLPPPTPPTRVSSFGRATVLPGDSASAAQSWPRPSPSLPALPATHTHTIFTSSADACSLGRHHQEENGRWGEKERACSCQAPRSRQAVHDNKSPSRTRAAFSPR